MKLLRMVGLFGLIMSLAVSMLPVNAAWALAVAPGGQIVISQAQLSGAGTGTAGQEFVELFNNSDADINVTGWCVTYSSSSDATTSQVGCVSAPDAQTTVWLEAGKRFSFTSPDFETATGFLGDILFGYAGGMSGTSGHLRVLDSAKNEIDKLAWGAAINPETKVAAAPAAGKALQRKTAGTLLQDTNNNFDDFVTADTLPAVGGLYEVLTIVDVCSNIDGVQQSMPDGYTANGAICDAIDVCPNIDGVQDVVPAGYLLEGGICQQDQCTNISGLQIAVPDRYVANAFVCTKLPAEKLMITELLPNPSGDDTASEFIELYNPNDTEISLGTYRLNIGPNFDKQFLLPSGASIGPKSYVVIQSRLGYFTLVNTTSRIQLADDSGNIIDQTPAYANASDNMAWALVGDTWQYTNQPTPGSANTVSVTEEESSASTTALPPCGEGKYRNPLTNRCRSIETDAAVIAACDSGEYRNPETNRCRKIVLAASSLQPCDEGQERNSATNRCRSVAAAGSTLTPCKEGQERNPSTNRCRNVLAAATNKEPYAVVATGTPASVRVGWIVAGLAAVAALGYGAYEWRGEIGSYIRRIIPGKK